MHYVDEGSGDEVILCLHGEPSWSFLYRKMIHILSPHYRVVAPDLIGFGKSDKPTQISDYTFQLHYDSVIGFIQQLDLINITLVCQDWGGLLGLPAAMELADRFSRLVIMNTGLPTGKVPMSEGFMQWRNFAQKVGTKMEIGRVFKMSAPNTTLSEEVLAAYEAPFPDETYKAGAAAFPLLVPISPDDDGIEKMSWAIEQLKEWSKPTLVMFSDSDPVMSGIDKFFRKIIPTAQDQPEIVIEGAGHFLQEERGEDLAHHIHEFMQRTS